MHCSKAFQANAGLEDLSSDSRNGLLSKRGAAPRFSCAGLLLASALAASLAGCSGWSKEAHPERPNYEIYPASAIGIDYTELLVAPSRRVGESFEHGKPAIDAKKQRVFVGSSDHGLYALHAGDGSVIWRFETLGAVQAEVLYDEKSDTLFFGSNDGAMYHVAAADGKLLWRFDTRAEVSKLPVLSRGVLYFSNANDTVVAVAAKDGKKLWAYHRSPALGMEIAGHAGVTLHQGKLFTAFSDGNVVALDTHTGREAWRPYDLSAEAEQNLGDIPQYLDVDTTPIYGALDSGDAIFVASYVGGVTALEADSGTPIWDNTGVVGAYQLYYWEEKGRPANAEKHQSEIAPRRLLIAASGYSGLWALDPETGETVWHRALPKGGVGRPVRVAGALLFGTTKQGIFLLNPIDGEIIDGLNVFGGFSMFPSSRGNRAFVMSNTGRFFALTVTPPSADAGKVSWRTTNEPFPSSSWPSY